MSKLPRYVRFRGQVTGPFGQDLLEQMAQRGQLTRLHELSEDRAIWKQAGRDEVLFPKPTPRPAAAKPPVIPAVQSAPVENAVEMADFVEESSPAPIKKANRPTDASKSVRAAQSAHPAQPASFTRPGIPAVPPPSGQSWFYVANGQSQGPVEEATIRRMIASGQLAPTVEVWTEGLPAWTPLESTRLASGGANERVIRYGGFCRRVAAYILDQAVLTLLRIFVIATVFAHFGYIRNPTEHWGIGVQLSLLIIPLEWIYFSALECSALRGTLGKKALNLHVARMDGTPISFGQASGRYWGKWLSAALFCAGFISAAFDTKKQGLHDKIASTLVLRGDGTSSGDEQQRFSGFWVRVFAFAIDQAVLALLRILIVLAVFAHLDYLQNPREHWILVLQLNLLFIPLEWIYFSSLESSLLRGTLGKRAMDIHVTALDGIPIGFGQATGRYFAKWLSAALIGAGCIAVAFDPRKRGLHDMVAGTLVSDD